MPSRPAGVLPPVALSWLVILDAGLFADAAPRGSIAKRSAGGPVEERR